MNVLTHADLHGEDRRLISPAKARRCRTEAETSVKKSTATIEWAPTIGKLERAR